MSEQEQSYVTEYIFNVNDDLSSTPVGRSAITGDEEFYREMFRVLGNLKQIKSLQPNCGTLVSFVKNSAGESIKITLV